MRPKRKAGSHEHSAQIKQIRNFRAGNFFTFSWPMELQTTNRQLYELLEGKLTHSVHGQEDLVSTRGEQATFTHKFLLASLLLLRNIIIALSYS